MGNNKMSRRMWKATVCGWMLWGAVTSHAAEFSVGRVDIRFADEGWKEVPLPDRAQNYGGEKSGALAVQAKLFVREQDASGTPVLVLVSTNSAGMGGGRGGYMAYSPNCKSDEHNYREGNEGFNASFLQCLTVTPRYNGASVIKALAPQLEGALKTEGAEMPPFYTVWSRHAISTGSFVDVRVFTVFPLGADDTAAVGTLPRDVPPAHVVWGRQLKDAVKSSVYSLSGRLEMPTIKVVAPPPPPSQPAAASSG
jgi:hypothetical protein